MSKPVVLITSAAGRIGRELIARLAKEDTFTIRACYFTESKIEQLKALGAHEAVKFDLNDSSTWQAALEGVTAVYSASLDPLLEGHLAFSKEWDGNRETRKMATGKRKPKTIAPRASARENRHRNKSCLARRTHS